MNSLGRKLRVSGLLWSGAGQTPPRALGDRLELAGAAGGSRQTVCAFAWGRSNPRQPGCANFLARKATPPISALCCANGRRRNMEDKHPVAFCRIQCLCCRRACHGQPSRNPTPPWLALAICAIWRTLCSGLPMVIVAVAFVLHLRCCKRRLLSS